MIRNALAALAVLSLLAPAALAQTAVVPEDKVLAIDPFGDELVEPSIKQFVKGFSKSTGPTERDIQMMKFAQMEQLGQLPVGFTSSLERDHELFEAADNADQKMAAPPTRFFRDIHVVCDVDGDGVNDLVINQINRATLQTAVYAYSGATGDNLWFRQGLSYLRMNNIYGPPFAIYNERGYPHPWVPDNFASSLDVNDDGVCDFILWGTTVSALGIDPVVVTTTFTFSAVNGSWGYSSGPGFWTHTERSTGVITFTPEGLIGIGPICLQVTVTNFVTGFEHAYTPAGARFIIKTSDTFQTTCAVVCPAVIQDWRTNEHIKYMDAKTKTIFWQRDLNFSRDDDATLKSADPTGKSKEKVNNITYISGLAQLSGNDELEVVLHQWQFTTPRSCNYANPVDGRPIFWNGNSITQLALRGERGPTGGNDLWRSQIYSTSTYRVNTQNEESFEIPIWNFAQILGDMTGDGVPEVFASYLAQERNQPTSTNGAFRTHIHPLDGKTGAKLLGPNIDIRVQGWGYSAWMGTKPSESVPYFAVGTADVPTGVSPAARFPPKDVRLAVYDITDGAPLWEWRELFSQDSFTQFDMTLNQYLSALAPYDYNEDGLRELLTPAQYVSAYGANQTLLAQSEHFYQTLDARTGEPIHTIKAWGPTGVALTCQADDKGLMVFSGHARRIDATRYEMGIGNKTVTQSWRHPLFNNPDFAAATAGSDIASWGNKCIKSNDGRLAFGTNPELFSGKRGLEIKNVFGFVEDDGELQWQLPPVEGKPPLNLEEILRYFEIEQPSSALTLAFTAGPIAPGIAAGIGLGRLRARKGGL